MRNTDWFLFVVVVVAFIAGYSVVSFLVKKMKSQTQKTGPNQNHTRVEGKGQPGSVHEEQESGTDDRHSSENQYQQWQKEQARQSADTWESGAEERQHATVLGLRGKVTPSDVKRAYRELLAKYHPDKVDHLGSEFQRIAEQRTRDIIAAYEFFRIKYDIK